MTSDDDFALLIGTIVKAEPHPDDSDNVLVTFADGRKVEILGEWHNDSTAGVWLRPFPLVT